MTKTCNLCLREKSWDCFYQTKYVTDGHSAVCKVCSRKRNTYYYSLRKASPKERLPFVYFPRAPDPDGVVRDPDNLKIQTGDIRIDFS
jgi:hypothetical protein